MSTSEMHRRPFEGRHLVINMVTEEFTLVEKKLIFESSADLFVPIRFPTIRDVLL